MTGVRSIFGTCRVLVTRIFLMGAGSRLSSCGGSGSAMGVGNRSGDDTTAVLGSVDRCSGSSMVRALAGVDRPPLLACCGELWLEPEKGVETVVPLDVGSNRSSRTFFAIWDSFVKGSIPV